MNTPDELLSDLNEEQKAAVIHKEGPLLIVAGAGTGKTTVITRKIAWLIMSGVCKPEELLALTFTEKAAGEMEERVDRILPYGYVNLWISTFHSFCQRILERHGLDIGIPHRFKLFDQTASWILVRKNFDRFDLHYYRPLGNPTKFIHALIHHFSRAKDEAILPEDYLRYADGLRLSTDQEQNGNKCSNDEESARIAEIAHAYHTYQQLLLEHNALDFGDLLIYTRELFLKRPVLLERYRAQFKYILVDEFQDTNWVQYEIIRSLASPRNNVTVVGDDDQAIFLWRGASYHNILQFKTDFPLCEDVYLTKNYRSGQLILDTAHAFIQHNNPDRLEYQFVQRETGDQKNQLSKKLIAHKSQAGFIQHIHCTTLDEEAEAVVKKIGELKNNDPTLLWSDIAILVRANDSAHPFIEYCAQGGIPYHFFALKGLYAKPVILDCIAYCTLVNNYHESTALWRALTVPFADIAPQSLVALTHYAHAHACSLWNACEKADLIADIRIADKKTISDICARIIRLAGVAHTRGAPEVFLSIVRDTGYLKYLKSADTENKRNGLSHLDQLYKKIKSFQQEFPHARIHDFCELISLEQEAGEYGSLASPDDSSPDVVHIQTCHSAKGLEFRYVFVVNLVDRRFPTIQRADAIELPVLLIKEVIPKGDAHIEEERRLFYVALTRAKDGCFLLSSDDYGTLRKKKPSQFLYEAGFLTHSKEPSINKSDANSGKGTVAPYRSIGDDLLSISSRTDDIKKDIPIPIPTIFSFSQLAAFQKCPLQYKFCFLLKIPVFGKASLSFGRTLHETLHHFFEKIIERNGVTQGSLFTGEEKEYTHERSTLPSLEELLALYEESWIDEWYSSAWQKEEHKKRGRDILLRVYHELETTPPHPLMLEKDFIIKIGEGADEYTLKGRIDRIDAKEDGTVEIVDYKTGQSKDGKSITGQDKEQLLWYQIATQDVLGISPSALTYYYLDDGKKISFLGTDGEKESLKQKAREIISKIAKSDFRPTPGFHCKSCDFRDICEYRKN